MLGLVVTATISYVYILYIREVCVNKNVTLINNLNMLSQHMVSGVGA